VLTIIESKNKMGKKTLCNSQEEYDETLINKQKFKDFIINMKKFIVTSRFNNNTWKENQIFRDKIQFGCIYCAPDMITTKIPTDSVVFVLEMNNDTNKIMGIGMVRNHPVCGKYCVYSNGNYNRFVYSGKYRIDRNEMTEEEDKIMQAFDILCFKGNTHMKRGQGLKSFPVDMLFRCKKVIDLVDFVSQMFKERISKENIQKITKEVEN
jgi:hypothetical protein